MGSYSPAAVTPRVCGGQVCSNVARDLVKLVVVNRYQQAPPVLACIKNLGLRQGAMTSSVAHDPHTNADRNRISGMPVAEPSCHVFRAFVLISTARKSILCTLFWSAQILGFLT